MAKGYTTPEAIASQLGRTLTTEQVEYVNTLIIPATEQWIDDNTGHPYGESAVVAENLVMSGPYTWLSKAPVTSIEAVRVYYWNQQPSDMFTLDPNYYLLRDPSTGYFWLPSWRDFQHIEIDYTPNATIPDSVKLAAAMVAGVFMRTALHPETEWMTDYASGQDLRVKFRDITVPDIVYTLLGTSSGGKIVVA